MNIKEEVDNDFKSSLSKIDFTSYNPLSNEFVSALYIGLMSDLLNDEKEQIKTDKDDIQEELFDAKKYLQKYIDTGDESYKIMAEDEIKHAGILIKKAMGITLDTQERNKLKMYESQLEDIKKQVL